MCLYIKNRHKVPFVKKWRAKKLHKDLVVYKNLKRYGESRCLATPYQDMDIYFDADGIYRSPLYEKQEFETNGIWHNENGYDEKTAYGYHAYLKLKDAVENLRITWVDHMQTHKAIVPKGSYVFYGMDDEICVNQIFITDKVLFRKEKNIIEKL